MGEQRPSQVCATSPPLCADGEIPRREEPKRSSFLRMLHGSRAISKKQKW